MTSALRSCFDSGPELWPLTLFCVVDARSQVVVEDPTSFYDFGLMLLWIYGLRGLEEKSRSRIKVGLDLGTISFSIRTHEMSVAKPTTSTLSFARHARLVHGQTEVKKHVKGTCFHPRLHSKGLL